MHTVLSQAHPKHEGEGGQSERKGVGEEKMRKRREKTDGCLFPCQMRLGGVVPVSCRSRMLFFLMARFKERTREREVDRQNGKGGGGGVKK